MTPPPAQRSPADRIQPLDAQLPVDAILVAPLCQGREAVYNRSRICLHVRARSNRLGNQRSALPLPRFRVFEVYDIVFGMHAARLLQWR